VVELRRGQAGGASRVAGTIPPGLAAERSTFVSSVEVNSDLDHVVPLAVPRGALAGSAVAITGGVLA